MASQLLRLKEALRLSPEEARVIGLEVATTHPLFKDKYYHVSLTPTDDWHPSTLTIYTTIELMCHRIKHKANCHRGPMKHRH